MNKNFLSFSLFIQTSVMVSAQSNLAAKFDMSLNSDGTTITETVSGKKFAINYALTPENVNGAVGKALYFDGYSNFIKASIDSTQLSTSAVSFSIWIAPESYPMMSSADAFDDSYTFLAGNLDATAKSGFAFLCNPQGCYRFAAYSNGWLVNCTSTTSLSRYVWNHLVATIDVANKQMFLYNNGEKIATANFPYVFRPGSSTFIIGKSFDDVKQGCFYLNTFCGLIDDITIYNKVLSVTDKELTAVAENAAELSVPESRYANDMMRPSYHGMPATGWTNETHGLIYYNNNFHVFFQKNPNGPYMARLHWGHIYSSNLYKWYEDNTAIDPEDVYDIKGCWSGCVFQDNELTHGRPALIYTGVDYSKATIDEAFPNDSDLIGWTKSTSNPIISGVPMGYSDDFRDPYFFSANGNKYIIVGSSMNGIGATILSKYDTSANSWSNDGTPFFYGTSSNIDGTFWEMPSVNRIGDKWIFCTTPIGTSRGTRALYWTGNIDSKGQFTPTSSDVTSPSQVELISQQGYGMLSPSIFKYRDKYILIGIVPDKLYSEFNYQLGWAHTYCLPREISIDAEGKLVQKPYSGLAAMRTSESYGLSDSYLLGTQSLSPVAGRKYELYGKFIIGAGTFGFNIFKDDDKEGKIYYDPAAKTINVDISNLDRWSNDAGVYDGVYSSELPKSLNAGDTLTIHAFIDHSILDIFINEKWAFSMRVFPTDKNANGVEAFASSSTYVKELNAWMLDENQDSSVTRISQLREKAPHNYSVNANTLTLNIGKDNTSVNIYDLGGTLINKSVDKGQISLKLPLKGIYILKLSSTSTSSVHKIVL